MIANRRIGVLGLASTKEAAFGRFNLEFIQRGAAETAGATASRHPSQKVVEVASRDDFEGIIGRSAAICGLRNNIKIVAPTDSTVLLLGETGTGKELVARAIHNLSSRRQRPFIKVNCAAIPSALLESELFGHERGAFTGAVARRIGRFEMAHGGTLFLDEIGDLPLDLQPKLLRVLQEHAFERLGGTLTKQVDVRLLAATSRNLPRMIASRLFRSDLYYRLNVFPVHLPALRERTADLALLTRHFVDLYAGRMHKTIEHIPMEAIHAMSRYPWPGNVRELQNFIERSVILSPGKDLCPPLADLTQPAEDAEPCETSTRPQAATFKDALREHIIHALVDANWVIGGPEGAAARLGLQRTTLISKMRKLGISRAHV
jgi:formate hydrogenlyase transcriptional activator